VHIAFVQQNHPKSNRIAQPPKWYKGRMETPQPTQRQPGEPGPGQPAEPTPAPAPQPGEPGPGQPAEPTPAPAPQPGDDDDQGA
jgi:hypothetical protein